ncbi:hypothetical protein CP061683_2267, partial [Chlamydia psittaci 06-1683]
MEFTHLREITCFFFGNPPFKRKSRTSSSQIPHLSENQVVFSSRIPNLIRKPHVFSSRIPHLSKNHAFSL